MEKLRETALAYVLQNAVFYKGKASPGAVLGKLLAANPDLRSDVPALKKLIEEIAAEVNSMSPEEQEKALEKKNPKMLRKEVKKREGLPEIKSAVKGKFVTRFAPSPTGPLNLGQLLRAAMLPYLYAKKYDGTFILRIEDTDPKNIGSVFYDMIKEDLMRTGIKWDKLVLESDSMDVYYRHAEELVKQGKAYVCTCPADEFRKLKAGKKECPCRNDDSLSRWKDMLSGKYGEGEAIVRFKTSMSHRNPAMRDPPMLRVAKGSHPVKGDKYHVWPLYNFACAIEDHYLGVTHVFRGKEHEHNTSVQKLFYDTFAWKMPEVVNFGMVYLPGTKIHTRDMKQWIDEGKVSGWDDTRLPTVRALLRRGFQPEAFRMFAEDVGITKNDIRVGWENIEGINRKLIDSKAGRYMAVLEPQRISITGAPAIREAEEQLHPDFPERGKKKMPVDFDEVYVSGDDFRHFSGKTVRLKGLGNIVLGKKASYAGNDIVQKMPKLQWVSKPHARLTLLTADGEKEGLCEPAMLKINEGSIIQLERIGFGRIDAVEKKHITVCFAHK
ncbi:MAG: glutamate--tRNA ligase [Candidatus Aenigmarchaeota archaeon]|nr:glutamate--tRNA ligase [Candidatus Aenigmarchaeota archaeon]